MTEKSARHTPPRRHRLPALLATILVAAGVGGGRVAAQTSAPQTLRQQVEQRFDVLTVTGRPRPQTQVSGSRCAMG